MDDLEHCRPWLVLLRTPGLGPSRLRRELDTQQGDIEATLEAFRRKGAAQPGPARDWLRQPDAARLAADLAWLAEPGHRLLTCLDEDFPPQLADIPQPPVALFTAGDTGLLLLPQVAIVGARAASLGGRTHARAFAQALGWAGFAITSGMADGIDGAAHQAALEAGLPTVAVVGTGPDLAYPRRHRELARRIAAHGAMVSEFPPGTPARSDHFPRRNRILSGLALGTLVVEAGLRSGSLITARLAAEQGREVFALPGSIHNPLARGCHQLLRDGARLVESASEIVEVLAPAARALGCELASRLEAAGVPSPRTPPDAAGQVLLDALGHGPMALDELAACTGLAVADLAPALLMLELDGRIEVLPGGRYQRLPD
ncbi:DNA-processing protein DprA [Dyella sedimenti]|uniref:DNA-processing protein DprA n=1 Tax=Dyella sedimenti TaxID=2919947 RepID=UPI001FAB1E95|nr:DNA-processing protein DprA [Dyella sedimenti]